MSMEKAMAALNAATNTPAAPAPEMPVNMANGGANEKETPTIQTAQEVKENATDGLKTDEGSKDGVVEAAIQSTAETTTSKTEETAPPISSKFAALAKKEKVLVKLQADIKAKEAAIAAKEAEILAKEAKLKESEEMWNKDVFKALQLKGYDYNKLTEMMLKGELVAEKAPEDPVKLAEQKIKEFEEKLALREKEEQEKRARAEEEARVAKEKELEEAYNAYRKEVEAYTSENGDNYELINLYGQHELVIETVQSYYDKHKRVLSVKEASDMVEKYLYDEAQKAIKSKKFSKKEDVKKTEGDKVVEKKETASAPASQTKTLTNNLQPTMSSVLPAATDAERMKRALNALNTTQR